MNLFLSRICLNPMFAPALKLAADPYELHRKLLDAVLGPPPFASAPKTAIANQPKTAEVLFRVESTDTGPVVLVQTGVKPDWDAFELAPRALRSPLETKPYSPKCYSGLRLAFRLLCQPVFRKSGQFGTKANGKRMPGPRKACRDDEQRLEWLRRKGNMSGFAIETVGLTLFEWRNTKRLQGKGGAPVESFDEASKRASGGGMAQRLGAVRFDGVLVVTESTNFGEALRNGIGPQKAFGFGLLSIAPAEGPA